MKTNDQVLLEQLYNSIQDESLVTEAQSGRELLKLAKTVAVTINNLYPRNKKAMAAAIPVFMSTVRKHLNIPVTAPTPSPKQPTWDELQTKVNQMQQSKSPQHPQGRTVQPTWDELAATI